MEDLGKLEEELGKQIPDFVACAVVEVETGLTLAGYAEDVNMNLSDPAGLLAEVVKGLKRTSDLMSWGKVEGLMIQTDSHIILAMLLKDGAYYQGIIARRGTTLGMVRAIYNKMKNEIEDALP